MLEVIHRVLFALISGLSEFLPLSMSGHRILYQLLTGRQMTDDFLMLAVHIGCFLALYSVCRKHIKRMRNEKRLDKSARRRHLRTPDGGLLMDMQIVNTAVIAIIASLVLYRLLPTRGDNLLISALMLLVYGLILYLPRFLQTANKNGYSFTMLDGLIMGVVGGLSIFPGFGRFGCMYSAARIRGADRKYAMDLSLLICLPALGTLIVFDLIQVFGGSAARDILDLLSFILSGIAAFAGVRLSVSWMKRICDHFTGYGFAYYNIGLSFFFFLIYLIIP